MDGRNSVFSLLCALLTPATQNDGDKNDDDDDGDKNDDDDDGDKNDDDDGGDKNNDGR